MKERTTQLRAEKILSVLKQNDSQTPKPRKELSFEVLGGLITLTDLQKNALMRALEIYFPQMYVEIKFKKPQALDCEGSLKEVLDELDTLMSAENHFELYKNTNTEEYNFLVNLRLKHMLK